MREINLTTKIAVYLLEECSEVEKKLIEAAKSATTKAYAPYSQFRVGAAVLLENGEVIAGNNQENAAYPSGLCAERTTLFFANATFPDQKVEAIAIAAWHNGEFTRNVITPCGACRQVLLEAENRFHSPVKVLMYSEEGIFVAEAIKDLLPLSFGDEMLK
ncbi:MAG: cytidine deaminase [Bacteroidetes bacterium GWD2_45_23]|jgi:cytidine deaminase|nr:MAG: cytidine deaminase [Bacteroidetes bacterium GWC2_46_850]OFX85546.1 MAG: cytidine deaminase [Bacteroidetes bacterium GWD2_45_23]HAR37601.1 cytidine deaminase [Porphyromonadaceae bacterium]HBB00774.1 cytidine deaminase [Porphyromonadaceae bacterium]HCC19399.1 cytidine deaminase [Porphyromonadaceae bacterium]